MTKDEFLQLVKVPERDGVPTTFILFDKPVSEMDEEELRATCLWLANELDKYKNSFRTF